MRLAHEAVRGPRRRRGARAAVLALVLAVVAAGCGGTAPTAAVAGADFKIPVKFFNIIPIESLTFTPEIIAEVGGFFEREGLDVEFELSQGSAAAIQNVLGGSGLLTRTGDIETMIAITTKNATITAVAQPSQRSTLRLVSLADNPVRTPADMRGHVVGVPSQGGTSETLVDLLSAAGGLAEADLNKQVVGVGPGLFDLVREGRVDAYVDSMDNAIALQQKEPDAVVLDPSESTAAGTQIYVASQRALADPGRRDAVARYMRAIRAAMESVIADTSLDRTLEMLRSRYDIPILADPDLAKDVLRDYIASWQTNGELLVTKPDRWDRIYDEVVGVGLVPPNLDPTPWYTNDLLAAGPP